MYSLPLLDASQLVLGENGVVFATGPSLGTGQRAVSFDMNSGQTFWTYEPSALNGVSMIAATLGGELVAKVTDQLGNDSVLHFDEMGQPTYDGIIGRQIAANWQGQFFDVGGTIRALPIHVTWANDWAEPNGNSSGTKGGIVHHSFGLFWCGTDYAEMGSCKDIGGVDIPWKYIPGVLQSNFNNAVDFSAAHPDWVDKIQASALDALQRAFTQIPEVTVERASSHKGSLWECTTNFKLPGCMLPNEDNRVYISGVWPGDGGTGETTGLAPPLSFVYYWTSLQNSQRFLNMSPPYPPLTNQDSNAFGQLLTAVGRGIGNASAHELGHQMAYTVKINMDCTTSGGNACQGDAIVFEIEGGIQEEYTNVYPSIHWQPDSVCAIHQYFAADYRDPNCKTSFVK